MQTGQRLEESDQNTKMIFGGKWSEIYAVIRCDGKFGRMHSFERLEECIHKILEIDFEYINYLSKNSNLKPQMYVSYESSGPFIKFFGGETLNYFWPSQEASSVMIFWLYDVFPGFQFWF